MSANETYKKLIAFLSEHNATYREIDHEAEGRTELVSPMRGNDPKDATKNIVIMVKLSKKEKEYILAIVPGDAKVNLDHIKSLYNAKYVSFATPEIAEELTGCVTGTVLPFSFNPEIDVIIDPLMFQSQPEVFFNAARLDKSLALNSDDYKRIMKDARQEAIALYESDASCTHCSKEEEVADDPMSHQRHSLAHLLAAAVLQLHPDAKVTLGPAIEHGFYYDIDFGSQISDEELPKIEALMREMLPTWKSFEGKEVTPEEAQELFKGNEYKLELIKDIANRNEKITLYTSGNFTDLCRGGHVDDMSQIDPESFCLDKVAGAYWRGDEKRPMLTRIYGLAFETKEELVEFKSRREEAKERDHRKIGKELGLFTFSELVGAGLPLFTPKGAVLRNAIVEKVKKIQKKYKFKEVWIPHITKPELYMKSGHWDKFGDELFKVRGKESEFVMKPMNCPHHTQIYASEMRSYKDLPLRLVETTSVYRDEQSGELIGLGRVRSITQDDGHTFCTKEQIEEEVSIIVKVIREFYTLLGMFEEGKYWVSLSVRDPKEPEKFLGDHDLWDIAENALADVAEKEGLSYKRVEGEAAFYGPKLDFMFKDALGRERQLGTAQLDFVMPTRFGLEYIDKDGSKQAPVMIHRAIAGSLERFLSVMIEHFAGKFPYWMSPVQIAVIPISEAQNDYVAKITETLEEKDIRIELLDDTKKSLGKKIQYVKEQKIPYWIVIGDEEVKNNQIKLESRDEGTIGSMSAEDLLNRLEKES